MMANVKHTPGDWGAWQAPDGCWAVRTVYHDERGRRTTAWPAVCNAGAQPNEHNARLIAAAPDMLAVLTEAKAALEYSARGADVITSDKLAVTIGKINAALAKATGAA